MRCSVFVTWNKLSWSPLSWLTWVPVPSVFQYLQLGILEWCSCCRLSRHCSRQALPNLRYVIRFIFIVWCTWCQATILAKASWYFIVLLCCAFNCCITNSFCVKHALIFGVFMPTLILGFFYTICLTGSQYTRKFCTLFLLKVVLGAVERYYSA